MSKDERDLQFMYLLGRADAMETARQWQALRDWLDGTAEQWRAAVSRAWLSGRDYGREDVR
jgi:hypothetical protein